MYWLYFWELYLYFLCLTNIDRFDEDLFWLFERDCELIFWPKRRNCSRYWPDFSMSILIFYASITKLAMFALCLRPFWTIGDWLFSACYYYCSDYYAKRVSSMKFCFLDFGFFSNSFCYSFNYNYLISSGDIFLNMKGILRCRIPYSLCIKWIMSTTCLLVRLGRSTFMNFSHRILHVSSGYSSLLFSPYLKSASTVAYIFAVHCSSSKNSCKLYSLATFR